MSFKDSLPANEQVELDLNNPDELAKNKCKQPEWLKSCDNVASASIGDDDGEIIL